jgi:clan AA aspartic protease (TIGR02281 family)
MSDYALAGTGVPRRYLTRSAVIGISFAWAVCLSAFGFSQDSKKPGKPPNKSASIPEEVTRVLAKHGLRIVGANLTLDLDAELTKEVKELSKFKKSLKDADLKRFNAESNAEAIAQQILEMRIRQTQLNAQLANVDNVVANNRLVGELNAMSGQMKALEDQQKKIAEIAKVARGEVQNVQEDFVNALIALRQSSDQAHQKWESFATNQEVLAAIETAAEHLGEKIALKPSATLVLAEKNLKEYEESMISESIPLENREGAYWIDVAINGNGTEKMVFDTGATFLSISTPLAKSLNVEPSDSDPDVLVGLADGRQIPGKVLKLATVRVGKFTANNVKCVVLGPQAINAPPLLGLSFLSLFNITTDYENSEVMLVKIDSGDPAQPSKKPKRK